MNDKVVLLADDTQWQVGQEVFWPCVFGEKITIHGEIPRGIHWYSNGDKEFLVESMSSLFFMRPCDKMGYSTHEAAYQVGVGYAKKYILGNIERLEKELAEFVQKYQELE